MQYIDKAALLSEIDRQNIGYNVDGKHSVEYNTTRKILNIIDNLEVKEVDLEHEVESYWKQCDMTWCRDAYSMTHIRNMLSDIAKHFYELGMVASNKTLKGE